MINNHAKTQMGHSDPDSPLPHNPNKEPVEHNEPVDPDVPDEDDPMNMHDEDNSETPYSPEDEVGTDKTEPMNPGPQDPLSRRPINPAGPDDVSDPNGPIE